jgi:urease accessory protein
VRFLRPTFPGTSSAAVCVVTFGAGLVDGDAISVDVVVEDGATLVLFTQASTKVFRGSARQSLHAEVHGTLVALPDPVAPFAGARYEQRVDVTLANDHARCVLLDGVTSGRPAFGERWDFDRVDLKTTIRRSGRRLLHDALRLDASDGSVARRMDRFESLVSLVSAGAAPIAEAIRGSDEISRELVVATTVMRSNGVAIARIAAIAPDRAVRAARARLRNLPEMDVMDPFASRS